MSERDERDSRPDLPSSTAEFRATPDASASTAQFKAFATGYDRDPAQPWSGGSWPEQPQAGESSGRRSRTPIIVGLVIAAAVVITIVVLALG